MKHLVLVLMLLAAVGEVAAVDKSTEVAWEIASEADPFTDEVKATASISFGPGILAARCVGKKFDVLVASTEYLGSDSLSVRYRFDSEDPVAQRWLSAAQGTGVFAGSSSRQFARMLLRARKLAFEVVDHRGVPHRAVGALPADSVPLSGLMNDCGVATQAAHEIYPSVPENISLEVERWGPVGVVLRKKIMEQLGKYEGSIDSEKDEGLYLAAEKIRSESIATCRDGKNRKFRKYVWCDSLKITGNESVITVSAILYEMAPEPLKSQVGKLRIGD